MKTVLPSSRPATLREQVGHTRTRYYVVSEPEGVHFVAARSLQEAQALVFDAVNDNLRGDPENPEPYVMTEFHPRLASPEDRRAGEALGLIPPQPPAEPCLLDSRIADIRRPRPARLAMIRRHPFPLKHAPSLRSAGFSL